MKLIYYLGYKLHRALFATYFRWAVCNPERVPRQGPVILAANHASFLDPPLIGASLPRPICYLARESLFRVAPIGWLLRQCNVVPVDRDGGGAAGLKGILDRLKGGNAILLFPEGTRTSTGQLQPARSGIGLAILKTTVPVIPVRVFGTYQALGRNHVFPRPLPLVVKYGRPHHFQQLREEAVSCSRIRLKELYHEAAQVIMEAIADLQPVTDKDQFP